MSQLHDLKEQLKSKSEKITENQNLIENLEAELREIQKNLNQSPQSSDAGSVCSEKSQEKYIKYLCQRHHFLISRPNKWSLFFSFCIYLQDSIVYSTD